MCHSEESVHVQCKRLTINWLCHRGSFGMDSEGKGCLPANWHAIHHRAKFRKSSAMTQCPEQFCSLDRWKS